MTSFKTNNNVIALIKSKTKIKNNNFNQNNSGIHKLKCSCGKFYVGRINKDFNTRYQ